MAQMTDIPFNTSGTRPFLECHGTVSPGACAPRAAAYSGRSVVPNRMSYAGTYEIKLAYAKHCAYAHYQSASSFNDPMEYVQIVDNTHKLQEYVPKSAGVSKDGLDVAALLCVP